MASQAEVPRRTLVHEHPLVPSTEAYSPADCDQCKGEQESTESRYYCCVTEGCKYVLCGGCINLFTVADEQPAPAVAVVKDHHYHADLVERALAVVEEYLGTNAEISGAAILSTLLPRHLTKEQFTDLKAHLGARPLVGLLERSSRLRRDTVNDRVTRAKIGDADTRVAPPRARDNTPSPAPAPSPSRPAIELMPAENDSAYYADLVARCVTIAVAEIRTKGEVSGADLFHTMLTRGDRFSESELADLKAHLGPKPLVELLRLTDKLQRGDYDRLYLAEDNTTARYVSPRMESSPVPAPAPLMPALDNAPNGGSPLKRVLLKRFIDGVVSRLQDTRTESLTSAAIFNPLGMMSHYVTSEELRELKEWFGPKPLVGLLVHAPQLRRVGKTDSVALALPNDGTTGNDVEASPMLNEEAYHAQLVARTVTLIVDHMNDNGFYYMPLHALWSKLLPQHFSKVEINDLRAYLGEKPLVALVGMTDKLARDAQNDRILLASRAHGSVHSSPAAAAPVEYEPETVANGVANGHHANGHTPAPAAPLVTTTAATVVAAASAASGKALPTIGRKPTPAAATTEPAPTPIQDVPVSTTQPPAQPSVPSPPAPAHVEGPPGLPTIDRKSTEEHRHQNGEVATKQEAPPVTASPPTRMEGPPGLPPLSAAAPPVSSSALKTTIAPPASSATIAPPVSRAVRKRPVAAAVNWSEAVDVDFTTDATLSTVVDVVTLADSAAAGELSEHTLLGHNTTAQEPVYLNVAEPFCFVTVGAQGSDNSHTLVNVIEGAMLRRVNGRTSTGTSLSLIKRTRPMTTLVCSYDKRATDATCDIASAYLPGLNQDLCVKQLIVLLSPPYFHTRRRAYQKQYPTCITLPLLFNYERLTPAQLMRFFSADPSGKVIDVLRECQRDRTRLSLVDLTALIDELELPMEVKWPLQRRLELLDSLLVDIEDNAALFNGCDEELANVILDENLADLFTEGSMVVADLTDPMLDVHDANLIFDTLIDSFTSAAPAGKLLVFDGAHRYLGPEKGDLSDTVSALVSSMHHSDLRVALSTQDPTTLPPCVLELASVVAIHANHSPSWFNHLRASLPLNETDFQRIVSLRPDNALVLSDRYKAGKGDAARVTRFAEEVRMRSRITRDSVARKI